MKEWRDQEEGMEKNGSAKETPPAGGDSTRAGDFAPRSEALLSIEEFARWDLRVARVVGVEPHPRADRLLKLRVDLGGEERQIVAGIAGQYRPESLLNRLIVVVVNLKPARLRGEESQGMLLAASHGERISLLVPDSEIAPGASIR